MTVTPTLDVERDLLARGVRWVIGCDEVGRGAIAGPVAVGACAVDVSRGELPDGLRDSKLLTEKARTLMAPVASEWACASAVGLAEADEIDRAGIISGLGAAGLRALTRLFDSGIDPREAIILLDGAHDWLSRALRTPLRVVLRTKADRDCGSVAAASVIAKVHRDTLMIDADSDYPDYGWASNKGYGAAAHLEAIERLGPTPLHRHTWLRQTLPIPAAPFGANA